MVKRVTVMLIDDLDGNAPADETVAFALDGISYQIDLSAKNAAKLRGALKNWIGAASRVTGRRRAGSATTRRGRDDTTSIREWARRHGYEVADRGRIPAGIIDAFLNAHR